MPFLVHDRDDGTRVQIPIGAEPLRIGRDPVSQLCLPGDDVSRVHATVRFDGKAAVLRDEGSYNGTQINGERVRGEQTLRDGDRITIIKHRILFIERDPYGEDSTAMPTPVTRPRTEEIPTKSMDIPVPTAPAIVAPAPVAETTTRSGKPAVLAIVAAGTVLVMALVGAVAFMAVKSEGPSGWQDAQGTVRVTAPRGFKADELSATRVQYLGAPGKTYGSIISASVAAAAPGASAQAEIAAEEQTLSADPNARFRKVAAAPPGAPAGGAAMVYERMRGGVLMKNRVVIAVADGRRITFKLSAEPEVWESLQPVFDRFLAGASIQRKPVGR